jgi:hypothetical protein
MEGKKGRRNEESLPWREFLPGQTDLVPFVNFSSITNFSLDISEEADYLDRNSFD